MSLTLMNGGSARSRAPRLGAFALALAVTFGCSADSVPAVAQESERADWRPNQPAGWKTVTDQDWTQIAPWNYNPRSSEVRIVSDPDWGTAAEFRYPAGFKNGNDVAFLGHYGVQNASGLYVAFRVKFSENWHWQDPGMKLMHIMADGWNVHLDPSHPTPSWTERYGANGGRWGVGPTAWGGPADGLEATGTRFNNVSHDAARVARPGVWQVVELQLIKNAPAQANGVLRLWVDGVLTAEYTAVRYPPGPIGNLHFAGTYGGGAFDVPRDMSFRLSDTFISIP